MSDEGGYHLESIADSLRRIATALEQINEMGVRCYTQSVGADSTEGLCVDSPPPEESK